MDLQTILRARNPETLELAMQMARQLKIEFSFNKELRNNENKTSQSGNKNNNGNRWSNNYQGNNPSGKNFGYKQNYNRGQNRQNPNNYNNVNRSNNFNSFGRNNNNNSNNYPRNNNNGQYNNNRRQQNNPGCYICGRTNHVARDCRGNIAQIARRNTNNNAQPQNNNARQNTNNNFNNNSAPITCSYCNKIGHDSVSCYSKQRDERNNANRTGNGQVSNGNGVHNGRNGGLITQRCLTIVSVINENHVTFQSPNFKTNTANLLLDTGSEINLIKINKLTGETLVNENEKINLKGINDKIVTTIGKITILLILNNNEIKTEFHVVDKEFPIPEKKGEFLGYLCDMIQREKHNVTTFLRRDEAPSCLRSHMENANKKLSEPYSKSELERYMKNITVFIHDVCEKNDLREQFCIVINDWLDAMPEADEMGDEMLGEILLYQYLGCMEFERNSMYLHIFYAHSEICWDWHEPHGTLTEESVLCKCLLDEFRREGNRRVHLTPIPYERPHMWLPTMNLLGSVSFFAGRDGSTRWGLKIRFLINLGRKIKHQRHTFIVGDREIPACFDHHVLCIMMVQGQSPYTIEEFKNETSIFYENQGEIRIIGAHWELITYIPLSNYDLRHYQLELEIKHMDEHCKGNMTDHEMCSKYDNVLKTTFNEISVQRTQMYESIGRYLLPTGEHTTLRSVRSKRGLINIIGSAMKTLFGVCDEECAEETLRHIDKVEGTNERMIHVIKDQTTVVKSSIIGINSASTELNKLYIELKQKQISLETNIKALINNTYTLETLLLSNRIFSIFTALMTQYSYETQTLSAIITAARTGVLHPSLVTPRELAAQLVDVKLNLPLNLNLPMGTLPSEIHEFTKITKIAVFYSGSQIVFLIKIPLITETQLTLFKIIPIPHPVGIDRADNKTHSIVLKPEYQHVGITKNRRQFTTFTETELLHCTETETFTICPEFQPVQHESKEQPCEISLFKNPDQLPQNCESGVIVISKNIFHKLKYANTWIYTTRKDTLTITCQGVPEPYIEKIKNQGIIKLNHECRAYAERVVLNPTREIKTKYFTNFIPKIGVGNISYKINSSIKDIKIEKYKHKFDSGKLDNVHEMAHSLNEVENMIDEEILRQSGVEVQSNTNSLMMYAIMALKETHKFVIMDFEFSMVNKTSMVVISGAISNSLDRFKIRKLEGRPLLLPLNEEARPMGETELQVAVKEIKRVFRNKTELRDACLDQLKQSLSSTRNNLTKGYIDSYIRRGNKENVIVVWNGHSDKNILKRLDLDHYPMLNITCYDKYFNKNFYIQFEKLNNRELIFEVDIGTYNKSGRLLNLVETHDVICKKKHHTTYAHDPRMDVKLEQLASAISFNIETQFHINPTQGEWHNYTACFDFHIITANENIIVPYEDETILKMIEAAKRFLSDMAVDREFGEPYCYELNYYLEIIQYPQDILNYSR
ncbi:hypothetical protein AGLY_015824 [Aphis glycines]|uniref:CCHC-type domain-containing protein n=1 Tax=Aphis glycines TaxID=307491 RepID=A0A6G0T0N3_APHGL|nr:hypothetical protein AGLY_015824 [Aphis glycines]